MIKTSSKLGIEGSFLGEMKGQSNYQKFVVQGM